MEIKVKENQLSYFDLRGIKPNFYKNASLPLWISNSIDTKEVKILDYGCGFGQIMHACLSQGYNNVFGVDIDIKAIQECKNHNLQVEEVNPIIMENPFDVKFDIIILSHVLEHIEKEFVIEFLQRLRNNFLSQEGKLLIAVPNAQSNTNCYWAYEDWTHNTLFTAGSLRFVLMAAGFNVIEFIDIDCKLGTKGFRSRIRNVLLWLYKENRKFWNKITYSYYHQPSPIIYSYEIKASARI